MRKVQKLPKHAKYDYTDIFGEQIWHTKKRRYRVVKANNLYNREKVTIYSEEVRE